MTAAEFRELLAERKLTQRRLAELIGVTPLTPLRWAGDTYQIPVAVALLLRLLQGNQTTIEELETLRRLYES